MSTNFRRKEEVVPKQKIVSRSVAKTTALFFNADPKVNKMSKSRGGVLKKATNSVFEAMQA